jgi:hypothetical protein
VCLFAPVLGDGDLDPRASVGGHGDDRRMFAEVLDLAGVGRANLAREGLGGHELVPESERRLVPDQNVTDPAAVAALPPRL